jgi:predicted Rossmann fold nucleotide-binding protein DprA/Smf involved in DNA uptake
MLGCIERGGGAIGITVDPLERLVRRADLRAAIADELLTLATPFLPGARWHQGNAMRRNRLIYAAAEAAVVVTTAAGSGGTCAGAIEDLKAGWVSLHVRDVESQGNRLLITEGGRPLTVDLEGVSLESLLQPQQDSLLPSPAAAPPEEPPPSAFDAVWPLIALTLEQPRNEKEVAELLELQPSQARTWLAQGVELGLLEVGKRPKLYSLTGKSNDAAQLHLDA